MPGETCSWSPRALHRVQGQDLPAWLCRVYSKLGHRNKQQVGSKVQCVFCQPSAQEVGFLIHTVGCVQFWGGPGSGWRLTGPTGFL